METAKGTRASSNNACKEYRGEESRPFPPMSASPTPQSSEPEKQEVESVKDSSENTIHPGENVFNFASGPGEEGAGPVRLTNLTPISPTNDEVAELKSNPQPPIASPIFQMLSPRSMQGMQGYPFLFSASGHPQIFSDNYNEKYRKLALKKQKRDSRKEKNVRIAFKAEEVEGYLHNENLDTVLQSLGEKGQEKDQKKTKPKKPKEKPTKKDKKELMKGSLERVDSIEDQEPVFLPETIKRGPTPTPRVTELLDFKDKFYLVPSPEPGPLARAKSREVFASNESLRSNEFTKVTTKKQRNKRSKEEPNPSKPPPPAAPPESRRVSSYNLRSSVGTSSSLTSPPPTPVTVPSRNNVEQMVVQAQVASAAPVLASEDFPELPGGVDLKTGPNAPKLASAWAKLGSKGCDTVQDPDNDIEVVKGEIEEDSDNMAVKINNCDVPSNSDIINDNGELTSEEIFISNELNDNDNSNFDSNTQEEENDVEEETEECYDHDESEEAKVENEMTKESEVRPVNEDIEVINSEEEFNSKRASNSAPVVILCDSEQDWKSSEFTFGFDVNEDLVAHGVSSEMSPPGVDNQILSQVGTYYSGLAPGAPLTPIDTVDSAILTFGAPDPSLRPLIVGVPVGVPVPVTIANGALHYSIFPHYSIPFPVQGQVPTPQFQDQEEPELGVEIKDDDISDPQDHQTISPESGISSASPLSWQPDASPSLAAPGSYPHPQIDSTSPPLVNHVQQSLSSWQGHSVTSSPCNSSRNSPTHEWTRQQENDQKVRGEFDHNNRDESETIEDDDSGLALSDKSVELRSCPEKFNLGEIITYVSSSWSSISKEAPIYYSNSVNAS